MALEITTERTEKDKRNKVFTLTERTCISRDGKRVIAEGKEDGALLGPAGAQIPEAQAIALGLLEAAEPAPTEAKEAAPAEDKAVAQAETEDKAGKKPAKKGKK